MTSPRRVSRRTMLKGLGTVAIGLPLLEEMLVSTATAAQQQAAIPVRAFNVFFGLGIPAPIQAEGFDGVGAYHDRDEHGNELREDGEILFPSGDQPVKYQTSGELMDLLAGSERVRKVITRKVTQFALGRPIVEADEPVLDKIHESAQAGGGTYASVITAIVMSDLVQTKGTETSQ